MSSDREVGRLQDIIDNIDRATSYVAGLGLSAFAADPMRIDAVERCLQRITEAVIRIGPERMKAIAPELPVDAVRGLGNMLRHEYDRIDLATIYATVTNRLPDLRDACEAALRKSD